MQTTYLYSYIAKYNTVANQFSWKTRRTHTSTKQESLQGDDTIP